MSYQSVRLIAVSLCSLVLSGSAWAADLTPKPKPEATLTYDSAACQISDVWCVGSAPRKRTDYLDNELLLLYDSNQSAAMAEDVMLRYRLRQKRSDDLTSVQTTMLTVATNGQDPLALVERIKKNEKEVDANASNLFYTAVANEPSLSGGNGYPLSLTGISAVQRLTKGAGVKIGMVDTPIDILHNSLDNTKVRRMELIPAGNARNQQHGTEVAGIMISQNPRIGVAPEASLFAVSAFSSDPKSAARTSTAGLVAKAIDLCIREKVDVLNLSFAGGNDPLVNKMIQKAAQSGIIVVASAGNGGPSAAPAYPAALDNVLAVTAVDQHESIFQRANRGSYIDLAAPGVDILTTSPDRTFNVVSGTSLATAHVTGVIALLLSLNRQGFDVNLLERTAVDLGKRGRDNDFGYGLVNVDRALNALRQTANSADKGAGNSD